MREPQPALRRFRSECFDLCVGGPDVQEDKSLRSVVTSPEFARWRISLTPELNVEHSYGTRESGVQRFSLS